MRPKSESCWIDVRHVCLDVEGFSILEVVVEEKGSKDHLKALLM